MASLRTADFDPGRHRVERPPVERCPASLSDAIDDAARGVWEGVRWPAATGTARSSQPQPNDERSPRSTARPATSRGDTSARDREGHETAHLRARPCRRRGSRRASQSWTWAAPPRTWRRSPAAEGFQTFGIDVNEVAVEASARAGAERLFDAGCSTTALSTG